MSSAKLIHLKEKLHELFNLSTVSFGAYLNFPEICRALLISSYELSKKINPNINNYICEFSDFERLVIDYFLSVGEYDKEAEVINFSLSKFSHNVDTHIAKLIEIIISIPVDYSFTLPLSISDNRLSTLDEQISKNIWLKGLQFKSNIYWQYFAPLNGSPESEVGPTNSPGDNLSIIGKYSGYVYKYLNNPMVERVVIPEIREVLALLTLINVLSIKFSSENSIVISKLSFYEGNFPITAIMLGTSLSAWIRNLNLSADAFSKSFYDILDDLQPGRVLTDTQIFSEKLKKIKQHEDRKYLPMGQTRSFEKFGIALNWYLDALTADNINTRLVNLCIVIEILLGSDNQDAWKKIEMPERLSFLIAKTINDRDDYRIKTEKAFAKRNAIVHNGKSLEYGDLSIVEEFHLLVELVLKSEFQILNEK